MTAEIGQFALLLALVLSALQASLPLYGAARGNERLIALARPLAFGQFFFVAVAFAMLTLAYVRSDFSLMVVATNSHTAKPMLYKVAGVWGNHEGSLLLWALILALFGAAVALFGRRLPAAFRARVLSVQAMIAFGFLLFMALTSNPFERLFPVPPEGNGLNPLLQDPGLAFHPPFLYLGYVGFSIAFSFAIAALIEGRVDPAWARWVRPWTLAAWVFLTIGIALGSWWAYYELGWGGWWFWDPVENASFMPWLAGTALLHSAIVVEKRDSLKSWTILLAIVTFSLSLLGTFIVRSGVITSVHAFASDPARGVFILVFLVIVVGGSLALYAARAGTLAPGGLFEPLSREGALVLNNLLLSTAAATVLVGTLYPLFLDVVTDTKGTVGPPYFNAVFIPLMVPLIAALGIGPLLSWKRADVPGAFQRLYLAAGIAIVAVLAIAVAIGGLSALGVLGLVLGLWLIAAALTDVIIRIRMFAGGGILRRMIRLPRSQWGMTFAHLGLGVLVLGITAVTSWQQEKLAVLHVGDSITLAGYEFKLTEVAPVPGPNYTAVEGRFDVTRNGRAITKLRPQSRAFVNPPMITTEAAIYPTLIGDLYAVIGAASAPGTWSVRIYVKPMQGWIWIGALLMAFGGMVSLTDRRYRIGAPARRAQPAEGL
ncbi:heme lyase CcmF/NrfE family subunit [Govanella unica]|uniref:Heme lyase CcmF/NrfE family subunit n=1 Tax=Govanella unica TaxID=2975056 RepID=A0A9X3TW25_9PROT|nr:heme lyase CcmF/NrfE family subunit [Govania unica]MDA5192713.1 heme lyase CcmF/NrfE family subunit [Govania unica]